MFESISLSEVCNIIILIGAVIVAAKNIYGFFKKPVDSIHNHAQQAEEKRIEAVLRREVPSLLANNCQVIVGAIDELKDMTLGQEDKLNDIQKSIDMLSISQLDLLRYNMNRIYYKYRPFRKILDCDKRAFIKFYSDYHEAGGNTWIDSLYEELIHWEVVQTEDELKS